MANKVIIYFLQVIYLMVIIDSIDDDNEDMAIQSIRDLGNALQGVDLVNIFKHLPTNK